MKVKMSYRCDDSSNLLLCVSENGYVQVKSKNTWADTESGLFIQ